MLGVKIDFTKGETKEMVDFEEALLRLTAEHPYIIEERRRRQVTETPENIAVIRTFFDRILNGGVASD